MKLLIVPLLLLFAGAGAYGLRAGATDAPDSCCEPSECRVEVECLDPDTCLVTCYDDEGEVTCAQEVECDAPCAPPCDEPCEAPCQPGACAER